MSFKWVTSISFPKISTTVWLYFEPTERTANLVLDLVLFMSKHCKNKEKLDILPKPSVSFYRKPGACSYLHKFCPVAAAWLCVYPQVPFLTVFCNFLIQKAKQSPRNLGKFTGVGVHTATVDPAEKWKDSLGFLAHLVRPTRPQQQRRFLKGQLRV